MNDHALLIVQSVRISEFKGKCVIPGYQLRDISNCFPGRFLRLLSNFEKL